MTKWFAISYLGLSSTLQAQSGVLSSYPVYSKDTFQESALRSPATFIDSETGDFLVFFRDAAALVRSFRVPSSRGVLPFLYGTALVRGDGSIQYTYSLENRQTARGAVGAVKLLLPSHVKTADWDAPANWSVSTPGSPNPSERLLGWVAAHQSAFLLAGTSWSGFAFRSADKPGFVIARVYGAKSFEAAPYAATIPEPAKRLVDEIRAKGEDTIAVLTIGPKFPADINRVAAIADFNEGIQVLVRHRHLSPASPFVYELQAKLRGFLESAAMAMEMPAAAFKGPSIVISSPPSSPLEASILSALRVHIPEI
jgi:hypothetical protein